METQTAHEPTLADLVAALRKIIEKHNDTTRFWHDRDFPTKLAEEWHNGFVTGLATCSVIAHEALDGEDELWAIAGAGSDREWFEATGNCGHCGNMGRHCVCGPDDPCYCGPHEVSTERRTCGACKGEGTHPSAAEVVAARLAAPVPSSPEPQP